MSTQARVILIKLPTGKRKPPNSPRPNPEPRGDSYVVRTSSTMDHERRGNQGGGEESTAAQTSPSCSSSSSAPTHPTASLPPPRATVQRQTKLGPTPGLRSHLRHAARAASCASTEAARVGGGAAGLLLLAAAAVRED
jgi:hypothetical protein